MKEEIFGIELKEEGIYWLGKFRMLAAIILFATITVNGLLLYTTLPHIINANNEPGMPSKLRLINTVFILNMVVNFILQAIQVVFYYRFASSSNKAIMEHNNLLFNQSFRWLYLQAITLVIHLSILFAYFLYSYFTRPA